MFDDYDARLRQNGRYFGRETVVGYGNEIIEVFGNDVVSEDTLYLHVSIHITKLNIRPLRNVFAKNRSRKTE